MSSELTIPFYRFGGKHRFVLVEDWKVDLQMGLRGYHELRDNDSLWAVLHDDLLTVMAGYACDGCSPAWRVFGRWYGTPTPPGAIGPAIVHDVLRGYLGLPCLKYDRKFTDDVFYNLLKRSGFEWGDVYHGAVAGFWGNVYIKMTAARPSSAVCACHPQR